MRRTHNFVAFRYKGYKETIWLKIERDTTVSHTGTIVNENMKGLKYGTRKKFLKSQMSNIEYHK